MRIISDFRDLYDVHQNHEERIWLRKKVDVKVDYLNAVDEYKGITWKRKDIGEVYVEGVLGFCFEYYVLLGTINKNDADYHFVRCSNDFKKLVRTDLTTYSYLFDNYPIFYIRNSTVYKSGHSEAECNCRIKEEFYRLFNPFIVYQELDKYIYRTDNNEIEQNISDIDLLVAKGFDKRTSFRKGKT